MSSQLERDSSSIEKAMGLTALAETHRQSFRHARPYFHVSIDNFLPTGLAVELAHAFPKADLQGWTKKSGGARIRKWVMPLEFFPTPFRTLVQYFHSTAFLRFLEDLSGIKGLQPDPSLWYAGLQRVDTGGFLSPHVDLNFHPTMKAYRCLSLNLYLSPNWKAEYGGGLRLYNQRNMADYTQIESLFNRCLIAKVSESTFHGYPDPVTCPEHISRDSLTIFYYRKRLFSFRRALTWENIWRA